jgi:hypothetical protein
VLNSVFFITLCPFSVCHQLTFSVISIIVTVSGMLVCVAEQNCVHHTTAVEPGTVGGANRDMPNNFTDTY